MRSHNTTTYTNGKFLYISIFCVDIGHIGEKCKENFTLQHTFLFMPRHKFGVDIFFFFFLVVVFFVVVVFCCCFFVVVFFHLSGSGFCTMGHSIICIDLIFAGDLSQYLKCIIHFDDVIWRKILYNKKTPVKK